MMDAFGTLITDYLIVGGNLIESGFHAQWNLDLTNLCISPQYSKQGTKKFRSDSPGLVDFEVRLVEFILHLPDGLVKVFGEIFLRN